MTVQASTRAQAKHFRLFRAILCFALALSFLPSAGSLAAGQESKVVRVGWYISESFQEGGEGEPKSGYSYDYLRKLADYSAWEYEYVYGGWPELYEKLCTGEIDLMGAVSKTDERETQMLFPDSAMGLDVYYLYKLSGNDEINTNNISSFSGKRVGLLANNRLSELTVNWFEENGIDAQFVYYDDFETMDAALLQGQIDLEPSTSERSSEQNWMSQAVSLGKEAYYMAVSRERPDLLSELNEAIALMDTVDPYVLQTLQYKNFNASYAKKTVTDEEKAWLQAHPTVKVGYIDNYLPYCATDADGQATGLMTDVLEALFAALEIDTVPAIEYIAYAHYEGIVAALNAGEIDIGFPVSDNAWTLEQDGISASAGVISDRGVLFYKGSCEKENVRTVAAVKGNVFQDEYTSISYPNAEIVYYATIDECLDAVLQEKACGTIMDSLRVQYVTNQSKYASLKYIQLNDVTGKGFGVDQGNRALLLILNRGLKILGTSYGYDRAFQYVDALSSYDFGEWLQEHLIEVCLIAGLIVAFIIILLVLYIKKQRRMIAEKEALQRKAEEANAAKSTFLFNMSHDIRTPMNAVLGFNELMLQHMDEPDKLRDYIGKIKISGEYLLELINNVLEVARIDSGRETLNEEFADLKNEDYYVVFENEVEKKHLHFERNLNMEHRYVFADAHKIREILLNILSNAVKYTPDGGTIRLSLDERPAGKAGYATYICAISDTGIGMTEEFQKRVFDTFAREHNSTESKVMGTGLGMTIVKKLTELMGGTVTVKSKPGEGSTFTVTMTLRIVEDPEQYLKAELEAAPQEALRLDGKRILLAEDNDLNAEIATAILENLGAAVEVAKDGVICIDMLQAHADGYYALILMDIQMPNLNGYDAARKIRALSDHEKANIPIIAMTANAFDEDKKAAFDAGMNAHVAKPIDVNELMKAMKGIGK